MIFSLLKQWSIFLLEENQFYRVFSYTPPMVGAPLTLDVGAGFSNKFHLSQTININPPQSSGRVSMHLSVNDNSYPPNPLYKNLPTVSLDFLQKSGKRLKEKGEREERCLSPLTFYLSPQECKRDFCKRSIDFWAAWEAHCANVSSS